MVDILSPRTDGRRGFVEIPTVTTSAGAADDGKVPNLGPDGKLSSSMMPAGTGNASFSATAEETLSAGDFVNINPSTGEVRLADNTNDRPAHGFVTAAVIATNAAEVFYGDVNSNLSGLTIGADYFLSAAGAVVTPAPTTSTHVSQYLGTAVAATTLVVDIDAPVTLA